MREYSTKRYYVFALLVIFVVCPCIGGFDYTICRLGGLEDSSSLIDNVVEWDTYIIVYTVLILIGFAVPLSYAFASDPIAGKKDGYFAFGSIATGLLFTITDFWFWIIKGLVEKIPWQQWLPPEHSFPAILPWRAFGIAMTTSKHIALVAVGVLIIFGAADYLTKKYC